jgi:TonB family protein
VLTGAPAKLARGVLVAGCLTFAPGVGRAQPAPPATPPQDLVLAPTLVGTADVRYPAGARGDAVVVLTLVIDRSGAVTSAVASEANEPFSGAAEASARAWRFEPATRGGAPVGAKIRFEVVFTEPLPAPTAPLETGPAEPAGAAAPARAREKVEVVVQGEHPEPSRTASLGRAEVRQIPGTFGDPFRAIEALPGVTPIVSGLPFFFVRGAPPGNVGYFLDGIRVPLLFHVGIGPSVVHPVLIDRVDLYPGGYPARFGRFAGGIVAGETTEPLSELHGEYNLRLFDAGAAVEAPFAAGRGTALVGGRYSYTAFILSLLSPETTLEYWDYQARATYDLTHDDRVGVFAFGSYDFLGQKTQGEPITLFATEFHRVDLRYDRSISRGKMRTAFTFGTDRSLVQQDRSVVSRLYAGRNEVEHRIDDTLRVRAGSDVRLETYGIELGADVLSPAAARAAEFFPTRTDLMLGTRADAVITPLPGFDVTPGLRIDLYASDGASAVAIEPRLATRTRASDRVHFLTAFGVAHQPPAFVVPVPGFQPGGLQGGLQRAVQESMGVELDLGDSTTLTATVFQNAFFDMNDPLGTIEPELDGCPPGAYPVDTIGGDSGRRLETPPDCTDRFTPGTLGPDRSGGGGQGADSRGGRRFSEVFEVRTLGAAYGLELFLKRKLTRKLGGLVSYTLSRSTRSYGRRRYVATFDRTHVANAALAYDLGRRWRAGTRLMFYTGLPTPPDPVDGSTRLPPFFRLDLRLEKRWQLGRTVWISAVAEAMNATLNKEAVQRDCTLEGCEAQEIGPVTIPSIGVEGGF